MYASNWARSTRHWPRPPILMAGRTPLRTSAYVWDAEMFRTSATSLSVRNRSSGISSFLARVQVVPGQVWHRPSPHQADRPHPRRPNEGPDIGQYRYQRRERCITARTSSEGALVVDLLSP